MALLLAITAMAGIANLTGCKTTPEGTLNANVAPETYALTDTIIRSGLNRLNTLVEARWWGNDADGYVNGFQIAVVVGGTGLPAESAYRFTKSTDSTITFTIPPGSDTADFAVYVRAVDNAGAIDPTPSRTTYPIKNLAPSFRFRYADSVPASSIFAAGQPSVSYPILRYTWQASDADGYANLERVEFVFNDTSGTTPAVTLSPALNTAIFEALTPKAATTSMRILAGPQLIPQVTTLTNVTNGAVNVLYARAIDRSGARSPWVGTRPVFIKRQVSDVLLANLALSGIDTLDAFYSARVVAAGLSTFDTLQLFRRQGGAGTPYTQRGPDAEVLSRTMALFTTVLGYSNASVPLDQAIIFGQSAFDRLLSSKPNARLVLTGYTGSAALPTSEAYAYTPIDTLQAPPSGTSWFLFDTTTAIPKMNGYPVLDYQGILTTARPIKVASGSQVFYTMALQQRVGAGSFSTLAQRPVMAYRTLRNGARVVVSSVELHRLGGNGTPTLNTFFTQLRTDFGLW